MISMKAKYTLLTHFSQRYAKIPNWRQIDNSKFSNTQIVTAFDHMRIHLSEFWKVKHYLPAIEILHSHNED